MTGGPAPKPASMAAQSWPAAAKDLVMTALGTSRVWVALAHGIVNAASMTVTSSAAGTTYVPGTDYTLDARTGQITRLAGGENGHALFPTFRRTYSRS